MPGPPDPAGRVVVYWMQHAQRASDNPALEAAIGVANELNHPVVVLFVLDPRFRSANLRHLHFMLQGLAELPAALAERRVGFVLRCGRGDEVVRFCREVGASLLVGDENPLREAEAWRQRVAERVRIPFWTVDADVVVPGGLLLKEQYSAGTIRPRIHRQLDWCLRPISAGKAAVKWRRPPGLVTVEPEPALLDELRIDRAVGPVAGEIGGRSAGLGRLKAFVLGGLVGYSARRNHPEAEGTSRLSPYVHFGQLGPREVALAVRDAEAAPADRHAFLEQLIVRRELATNFVRHNPAYDRLDGCARWARETLRRHRGDERVWIYTERQLEHAETHDPLWNAAERQMVESGWMHGYLRMYWGKKILEWTRSPDEAMSIAIALNDRYELDGRDPNGYAGIAWAIGGKHDRAWGPERPVFGTIRYMSFASTSKKFDSRSYMARWAGKAPG
ncbi:MAG TPA: deoxyribodipyrimidine photo-lyase [Vicinamibacterales bacterium]